MNSVTVFSSPGCPYCKQVKRFLDRNSIEYTDKDITVDKDAFVDMKMKSEQINVPVVIINDNVIVGFEKLKMKEYLGM